MDLITIYPKKNTRRNAEKVAKLVRGSVGVIEDVIDGKSHFCVMVDKDLAEKQEHDNV